MISFNGKIISIRIHLREVFQEINTIVNVRKHGFGKYKIITGDGMFLSPYYKGEGMFLGRGYYKPKRQRGVGHQFRGDGIIDTQMGIGSTILKHKDLIGSTASTVGNVSGTIKSIKVLINYKQ